MAGCGIVRASGDASESEAVLLFFRVRGCASVDGLLSDSGRLQAGFYRFLAGFRFSKAGLSALALCAYAAAYPEYAEKNWALAEVR